MVEMDPIIHTLLGFTVAQAAGASGPYEAALVTVTVGGALVADSDFIIRPLGPNLTLRYHHGPTHSIVGGIFLSALWAAAVSYIPRLIVEDWVSPFHLCWAFAFMGFLSHIGLDMLVHCNGLQLLWPFSDRWFRFPIFIGMNPMTSSAKCAERSLLVCWVCQLNSLIKNPLFYVLLGGVILQLVAWSWRRWAAIGLLTTLVIYALYTFRCKITAKRLAQKALRSVTNIEIFPANFSPNLWLAIGKRLSSYEVVNISVGDRKTGEKIIFPKDPLPIVEKVALDMNVKATLRNFIVPYGTVQNGPNGQRKVFYWDLAYYFTPDVTLHLAKVRLDDSGSVQSIDFRERW
jgi:membrane-bound metal-dependent hydrolase YbcI (DUF457 family)